MNLRAKLGAAVMVGIIAGGIGGWLISAHQIDKQADVKVDATTETKPIVQPVVVISEYDRSHCEASASSAAMGYGFKRDNVPVEKFKPLFFKMYNMDDPDEQTVAESMFKMVMIGYDTKNTAADPKDVEQFFYNDCIRRYTK